MRRRQTLVFSDLDIFCISPTAEKKIHGSTNFWHVFDGNRIATKALEELEHFKIMAEEETGIDDRSAAISARLKQIYQKSILPVEKKYRYDYFFESPLLSDVEFDGKFITDFKNVQNIKKLKND